MLSSDGACSALGRRGKYLVWHLSGDAHLAQHLRMTGSILCEPDPEPAHTRVRIELGPLRAQRRTRAGARGRGAERSGSRLVIVDPRRFGTGELLLGSQALEAFFAARLGVEPFDERFTPEHLRALARGATRRSRRCCSTSAGSRASATSTPTRRCSEPVFTRCVRPGGYSREQYARLREAIVRVLGEGIDARGATIDDFRHVNGVRGSFQDRLLVHRRAGEPCLRCASTIVKMLVAGRGTYVCETCQPRPRRRVVRPR